MKQVTIPIVTRMQDGQDGGYSMHVYSNMEEMLANHPLAEDNEDGLVTDEQREEIIENEDDYENGYVETGTIKLNVEGGIITLAEPLYFHAGQ